VITADLDYPRLPALAGAEGPGLILFRGGDWSEPEVTTRMQQLLQALAEGEIIRSIIVVDRKRVRRQRLSIT
jgi:predicted nuclease of predicted toxin-antitoxin system